jgi:hypothetical protein
MSEDTTASEHGADAETTAVPPPVDAPELAWSVDDDTDEMSTNRHGRLMWAGLAVLVVAITAALVLLLSTLFGRNQANNAHLQPISSSTSPPTSVAAAPAPPPTVTPPPPPTPAPMFSAEFDQQLLTTLKGKFYTILNPEVAIQNAHRFCELIQQQGVPAAQARQMVAQEALAAHPVGPEVGIESTYPLFSGNAWDAAQLDWDMLTSSAMTVYPHCGTAAN